MKTRICTPFLAASLLAIPLASSCAAQNADGTPMTVAAMPANFVNTLRVDAASKAADADGSIRKPFATIGAALKAAKPGDGVVVRGGTYRESFRLPSGEAGKPITLIAEAGQRVIISGFAPVSGWTPFRDKIQVATLSWKPDGLFLNRTLQPMAQEPNEGWYGIQNVGDGESLTLTDTQRLKNYPHDVKGGHVTILQKTGNLIVSSPIVGQDKAAGIVSIEKGRLRTQAGDNYQLKNHVNLIDRPGEWAFEKSGENNWKVYFWPTQASDLALTQSRQDTGALLNASGVKHVRLEGLEVTGSQSDGISISKGSSDVVVTRCVVSNNGSMGIRVRYVSNVAVTRCLVVNNGNGIAFGSTQNALIEGNEVAFNEVDGIIVSGDTSGRYGKPGANPNDETNGVVVRRNYVHHHLLSGHPDNFQMYRGVKNVKLIENLSLGGGQGLMTEEVDKGEMTGNVFVSSAASMVIFGHSNSNDWTLRGNTFALPGYSITSLTGKNYNARENVFSGAFTNLNSTYQGDYNLFTIVPRGAKFEKYASVADIGAATGQEKNSQFAPAAPLRSVPQSHAVGEDLTRATRATVSMRGAENFKVGDTLEINWDGKARTVTAVEPASIERNGKTAKSTKVSFAPALPMVPLRYVVAANWGAQKELKLDTRLATGNPAEKMAPGGGSIGASLDVAAFQRGDFDGDGKRDIPEMPADVQAGLPDPNALMTPMF